MSSLNKVQLIGNLGADPEVKGNGENAVTRISVATSEKFKVDGEEQERTEWHSVVAFNGLGKTIAQYKKKGDTVYVEGRIRTNSWLDKESGEKKYRTEVVADKVLFIGGKRTEA